MNSHYDFDSVYDFLKANISCVLMGIIDFINEFGCKQITVDFYKLIGLHWFYFLQIIEPRDQIIVRQEFMSMNA